MSEPKPMFLLAGGRPRDPKSMVQGLKTALAECGKPKPRVAYVGTASGDSIVFFTAVKALLKDAGAGQVDLLHLAKKKADVDSAKKTLQAADVVFITGGEVEDGIDWLVTHGLTGFMKELYLQGKVFVGVSAGSIMMGKHWVRWEKPGDDSTASLFDCLGLVPAVFDTHAEDEDWIELKAALKLMGNGAIGYGIPRDGMISANSEGHLINMEKELLPFVNDNGTIHRK